MDYGTRYRLLYIEVVEVSLDLGSRTSASTSRGSAVIDAGVCSCGRNGNRNVADDSGDQERLRGAAAVPLIVPRPIGDRTGQTARTTSVIGFLFRFLHSGRQNRPLRIPSFNAGSWHARTPVPRSPYPPGARQGVNGTSGILVRGE